MVMIDSEMIQKIAHELTNARSILFITGAGISADSGLPTYRGFGGLYNGNSTEDGISIEAILSVKMLAQRPELTWKYIYQIESCCRGAKYNRAHEVIAQMEEHFERVWVLTQNIDGLHRDAGSRNVIEIHGDVRSLICTRCNYRKRVENYNGLKIPPQCPRCDAIIRPDVVLFGEMLDEPKCTLLNHQLEIGFDMVFSIGTTSIFPYIAGPVLNAKKNGARTIEINPDTTEVSQFVDYKISAGAAAALNDIWQQVIDKG